MNTISAKKLSIGLLKSGLFLFILLFVQAAANAQERASYDSNTYVEAGTNSWRWNGGTTRTIYNPLDGGVFMKYTLTSQGNSVQDPLNNVKKISFGKPVLLTTPITMHRSS